MALNVNDITGYVEEQRLPLIKKTVIGADTITKANLQTGIKGSGALNILNTEVVLGDGSNCGWNEAGESKVSQRVLKTGAIKVNMSFCDKKLLDTWMNYEVKVAAGQKELPFAEDFIGGVIDSIKAANEKQIWQGDTNGSAANLTNFDGFLTILSGETSVITATVTGTAKDLIDKAYELIPVDVLEKAVIYVGKDTFKEYVQLLTNANLYHYNPKVDGSFTVVMPGTEVVVYGVAGLNGTDKAVAGDKDNFVVGVDLAGDDEKFEFWYSMDNREFRLAVEYNMGVQVAFPDEVVVVSK